MEEKKNIRGGGEEGKREGRSRMSSAIGFPSSRPHASNLLRMCSQETLEGKGRKWEQKAE